MKTMPHGLDYQGRYDTQPEAAHAASEIDDWQPASIGEALRFWAWVGAPAALGSAGYLLWGLL